MWLRMVVQVVIHWPLDVLGGQKITKVRIYRGCRLVCTQSCGCGAHRLRRRPSHKRHLCCLAPKTMRKWMQSGGSFLFCDGRCRHVQKPLPHNVRLASRRCTQRTRRTPLTPQPMWRAVFLSRVLLAVGLPATMLGWAAVVASSLNYAMHALNGNGPGRGRPSKIGESECWVARQKCSCEWLGVLSDGDVVKEDDKIRSAGVGCVEAVDMCWTSSIVLFVNVALRQICVGHTMKSSHVAPVGVATMMHVVLRAINVKVNVVDPRPLPLPHQGGAPVVFVENLVRGKQASCREGWKQGTQAACTRGCSQRW